MQLRQNCAPKSFTSGSQKWALNHHVNSAKFSRWEWSCESNGLENVRAYVDDLLLTMRVHTLTNWRTPRTFYHYCTTYRHHLRLQPTRTDVFRSVNNDGTLLSRRNVTTSTRLRTARAVVEQNSDMWKKDRRPHHAIKITNQKSARVQNESRLFYHRLQRYFDAVITPYIYISAWYSRKLKSRHFSFATTENP